MSCASEFAPQLRSRGYRLTPQRMTILHVLRHAGQHLSPQRVYQLAKKDLPSLTEPTVYRTLEFLVKNGLIQHARSGKGRLLYQFAESEHHHHHVVCRVCGDEVEVEHHILKNLYRTLESTSGYLRIDSHVTFFGVCPECQKTY